MDRARLQDCETRTHLELATLALLSLPGIFVDSTCTPWSCLSIWEVGAYALSERNLAASLFFLAAIGAILAVAAMFHLAVKGPLPRWASFVSYATSAGWVLGFAAILPDNLDVEWPLTRDNYFILIPLLGVFAGLLMLRHNRYRPKSLPFNPVLALQAPCTILFLTISISELVQNDLQSILPGTWLLLLTAIAFVLHAGYVLWLGRRAASA